MTGFRQLAVRSRPRFWLYLGGPVLVAIVFAMEDITALFEPVSIALIGYFLIPANVFLYGVNDVFDADIDVLNPKKVDGPELAYRGDRLTLLGIGVSALLGIAIVALTPRSAWPWFGGFFFLAVAYSAPPLQLKRRPGFDSIANGLYILPGVGAYVAIAGTTPPIAIVVGAWLWTMAMHTFSAIPDISADRSAGISTLATWLGHNRSVGYCLLAWSLAVVAFGAVDVRAGILLAVYPLAIAVMVIGDIDIDRAYWSFPLINALVGMVFTIAGLWRVSGGI